VITLTEEQLELGLLVRRFLGDRAPLAQLRPYLEIGGHDTAVWEQLSKELGLPALAIPESQGGMGYGPVELAVVQEQLGAGLYNGPFFSSTCLATSALLHSGGALDGVLPALASGERTAALAHAEPGGPWGGTVGATTWTRQAGTITVTGSKALVVDGSTADLLVITASRPDDQSALSLLLVNADADGVTRRSLPTLDGTRSLAQIDLNRAPAQLLGEADAAGPVVRRVLQEAAILLAAEQLGGAQRCLDMALDYAKVREQFGRAIGSFQAIKHRLVDTLLDVETARSAVLLALTAWVDGDDLGEVSSLARAHCSEVFSQAATTNVQVHGGIGFTWEHDAHLFLKRAKGSEALLGSVTEHRELLAQAIGL
jgi:alkylation response protein AidB-like acyl-CoA dehydrogenase